MRLVPPLLAAAYMATSAQKDTLDAQKLPPLPGPWTLMTVRVPPAVTTSRAMALPGRMSTATQTFSAADTSPPRAIESPSRTAAANAARASTPGNA